jgi:hypothetical protein
LVGLRPTFGLKLMTEATECRQKAAECQRQSKLSITPLDRQHWLRLAEHWLKMAETVCDD